MFAPAQSKQMKTRKTCSRNQSFPTYHGIFTILLQFRVPSFASNGTISAKESKCQMSVFASRYVCRGEGFDPSQMVQNIKK